jgi:SAM-dependent methyltransferase
MTTQHDTPVDFWEELYSQRDQIWSGNPNAMLVREVGDLAPGTALDLGCGEGGDAIWLAQRGWHVTAVDISATALGRGSASATAAGVAERIVWQQHDLAESLPTGTYDLVSAQFLHSPVDLPRELILRRAAAAVAPGGTLLVVGHAGFPPWHHDHEAPASFPPPAEVLASLRLDENEWDVLTTDSPERRAVGPDGQ